MNMGRELPSPSVAAAETRLDELRAVRRVLAARLDSGSLSPRDTVPIVRQLRGVAVEIEELELAQPQPVAELIESPFYGGML